MDWALTHYEQRRLAHRILGLWLYLIFYGVIIITVLAVMFTP